MDPDAATLLIRITKMDPDPHKKLRQKNGQKQYHHFYSLISCAINIVSIF